MYIDELGLILFNVGKIRNELQGDVLFRHYNTITLIREFHKARLNLITSGSY